MAGAGCRRGVLRAVGGSLTGGEDDPRGRTLGTLAVPLALLHNCSSETPTGVPSYAPAAAGPNGTQKAGGDRPKRPTAHNVASERWHDLWCSTFTLPFRTVPERVERPGLVAITDTKTCAQALPASGRSEGTDCILKP